MSKQPSLEQLHDGLKAAYSDENIESYWDQEADSVLDAIEKILAEDGLKRYQAVNVLGVGGSGVVLRLADKKIPGHDKALKFPRPVPNKASLIADMLSKEIEFLKVIRHRGVARLHDHGFAGGVSGYDTCPYYVMDFVQGTGSKQFCRSLETREKDFNRLVLLTAETIQYLANAGGIGFVHLDIKPDNVMVDGDGLPIIIDLGTCKRLLKEGDHTTVACTRSFAHPELVRKLAKDPTDQNRSKGEMPRKDINPAWDLWAFALTLLSWLGLDWETGQVERGAIYTRMSTYSRKYYLLLIARLTSYSPRPWLLHKVGLGNDFLQEFQVTSAEELFELLSRLDVQHRPSWIRKVTARDSGTIQAAPGVHVSTTAPLIKVLEHRLFRRLNTITQLGVVSQVYPSAKHTRREHSLGTYANTIRIIEILYSDSYSPLFRQIIRDVDIRDILLTALLHDIGQFPLAHDLEEIDKRTFNHIELTQAMMRGAWHKKKKGARKIVFDSLQPIYEAWATTEDRLNEIMNAKPQKSTAHPRAKLLRSLISGAIDADKLDYLFRDARHTDVPYPLGVDVERLFQTLTVGVIEKVEGGAKNVPTLAVHAKGRVAAEYLTIARYAMFSQVYWHHAVRAQKAMLFRAVQALLDQLPYDDASFKADFIEMVSSLPEALYSEKHQLRLFPGAAATDSRAGANVADADIGAGTDLSPTDSAVLSWLLDRLKKIDRPEWILIEGILSRKLYKRLWVLSFDMEEKRWNSILRLWEKLDPGKRHLVSKEFEVAVSVLSKKKMTSVTNLRADDAEERISEWVAAEYPWLLIDIPESRPGAGVGLHYVLEGQRRTLRKDDRAVGELQASPVWDNYAKHLRRSAGKVRVYCHPSLVDVIEASIPWEEGIESLEQVLEHLND